MAADPAARFFDPMHNEDWPIRPQPEILRDAAIEARGQARGKNLCVGIRTQLNGHLGLLILKRLLKPGRHGHSKVSASAQTLERNYACPGDGRTTGNYNRRETPTVVLR